MMTGANEIKLAVGELGSALDSYINSERRLVPLPVIENEAVALHIEILKADILRLYKGLILAGTQIDDLRSKIGGA